MIKGGILDGLGTFIERAGTVYGNLEVLKNQRFGQYGYGNDSTDHPYVTSGADKNGGTIITGQFVEGVKNSHLLFGVGTLLAVVGIGVALAWD